MGLATSHDHRAGRNPATTKRNGNTMTKMTAGSAEKILHTTLSDYKKEASALKDAHRTALAGIRNNPMTSDLAKKELAAELDAQTRSGLASIKARQDTFVKDLRDRVEGELRGSQPTDANSVLLRRDASERVRKITDRKEALAALNDALSNNDESMAHALGQQARSLAWMDVAEVYQAAHPDTAESAAAVRSVEEITTGPAFNVSNSITYSAPIV